MLTGPRTLGWRRRAAAAAASGVLFGLSQPGWGLWPLAFVCLLPLLWSLRQAPAGCRLGLGWISGSVGVSVGCAAQAAGALVRYFGIAPWQGWIVSSAIGQVYCAASFMLFALLVGSRQETSGRHAIRIATAWSIAELLKTGLFGGLPWILLSYSVSRRAELVQAAAWIGAVGVSGLLAGTNAALLDVLWSRRRAGALWLALFGAALLLPALRLLQPISEGAVWSAGGAPPGALRVLVLQQDVPPRRRHPLADIGVSLERLVEHSSGGERVDLVIWPENAISALLPANLGLIRAATASGGMPRVPLVLGAPTSDRDAPGRIHASVLLLDPERRIVATHDKTRVVPFAERMPSFLHSPDPLDLLPGRRPELLPGPDVALGPTLCYEVLFPGLVRGLVRDGAGLLLNLSNEAWFGDSGASEQLLAASIYRALETGRPVLRATNRGLGAAIDGRGRVRAIRPRGDPNAIRVDVVPAARREPFSRWGHPGLAVIAGIILVETFRPRLPGQPLSKRVVAALR